ncbi:MAG: hypothetical protein ABSB84_02790 [Verrucomicrobiota bacterium]|jgi:hypothetical protein
MTATNEDLTKAVLALSSLMATVLEMQATMAGIVTPLASNLNGKEKADLLYAVQEGRTLAAGLRETAKQLAES